MTIASDADSSTLRNRSPASLRSVIFLEILVSRFKLGRSFVDAEFQLVSGLLQLFLRCLPTLDFFLELLVHTGQPGQGTGFSASPG